MNAFQRKILWGALAAVAVTMLFPPFVAQSGMGRIHGMGFGFILSWPDFQGHTSTVDVTLLLAEWVAISMVASILWALKSSADIPAIKSLLEKVNGDPKIRAAIRAALDQMKSD
jgi:hypothetical protein